MKSATAAAAAAQRERISVYYFIKRSKLPQFPLPVKPSMG